MLRPRAAAVIYAHALETLHPRTKLSAAIQSHVEHARKRVAENTLQVSALMEARLDPIRRAGSDGQRMRFERCLDRVLGRARIYAPEPTGMYFPFLQNFEFFPREYAPWIESAEAATDAIRGELLEVLRVDQGGIQPYIDYEQGLPLNQWRELNRSRRWGAYFLWNQGEALAEHMARCPRTVEMLRGCPQVDIAGRGPTAFFSILDPRTKIPPHTGVTNVRLTVHLPLVVPQGCGFRVGGETREWRVGTAWMFDDTLDHEAWNDSGDVRAILIFDVWNPQLTPLERDLVREATAVIAEYNEEEQPVSGS